MLRANNSGRAGPSAVRDGERKVSDAVVREEADEEDWNLYRVMTVADADGGGLRGKFRYLKIECREVHTEEPAGLSIWCAWIHVASQ